MNINIDVKKETAEVRRVFSSLALLVPFAYPLIGWPIVFYTKKNAPIAGTNGITIFINPEKWNKLAFKQKLFVALHEWLHIALMHPKRMLTRQARAHNYACDFAINSMIIDDMKQQFEMPAGLYDDVFVNKSSEEIYKDLTDEVSKRIEAGYEPYCHYCNKKFKEDDYLDGSHHDPNIRKCPCCERPDDSFEVGEEMRGNLDREGAINQLMIEHFGAWVGDLHPFPQGADEQRVIDEVIKAAARHKSLGRGLLPGECEDFINKLQESEVPFERVLLRFAKQCLKGSSDRNPFRPDPKYLPFDIFIPREMGHNISKLVLICDTSGSMATEEFEYVSGHLKKLSSFCDHITLITADTETKEVIRIKNITHALKSGLLKFKGRGGTDMHDAFERADAMNPNLIILYSDMEIGSYPPKPKAPVVFLARESWAKRAQKNPYGIFLTVKDIK